MIPYSASMLSILSKRFPLALLKYVRLPLSMKHTCQRWLWYLPGLGRQPVTGFERYYQRLWKCHPVRGHLYMCGWFESIADNESFGPYSRDRWKTVRSCVPGTGLKKKKHPPPPPPKAEHSKTRFWLLTESCDAGDVMPYLALMIYLKWCRDITHEGLDWQAPSKIFKITQRKWKKNPLDWRIIGLQCLLLHISSIDKITRELWYIRMCVTS